LLNKYIKCNIWRLAVRHDIYIYIYIYVIRRLKVKNEWIYTAAAPECLDDVHRGSLTFLSFTPWISNPRPRL